MLFALYKSLCRQTETVENVEADPKRAEERPLHILEMEVQAVIDTKSPGVYSVDPRRRDLLHASVSETVIHSWRKGPTLKRSLKMMYYNVGSESPCQRLRWTHVMSKMLRVPREKMLYQNESTPRAGEREMWRPKQKDVSWMKHLEQKITRHGNVLMDFVLTCAPQ